MKIFISHSSKDEDLYIELANSLREQGHTVFNAVNIIGDCKTQKIRPSPLRLLQEPYSKQSNRE